MTKGTKQKMLWWSLGVHTILIGLYFIQQLIFGRSNLLIYYALLTIPIFLVLIHAVWTLGVRRGLVLLLIPTIVGFLFEYYGLKYGQIFGGHYFYDPSLISFFTVPISVIFYWPVFIYIGYCLTNSFLYWTGKDKPSHKKGDLLILLLLIIFDGLVVVNIDLFMDPVQVSAGRWTWVEGGDYFGIPLGNFLGWFVVVAISTGICRIWEYWQPAKFKLDSSILLIQVFGYASICLSLFASAWQKGLFDLAMVGLLLMLPITLLNFLLFLYKNK